MKKQKKSPMHLFIHEVRYLYSAELQLVEILPKIGDHTADIELQNVIVNHTNKSFHHLERLEKIGAMMNFDVRGKTCHAIKALIEETKEIVKYRDNMFGITDTALVAACMRFEKYEIARYKCALYMALQMGLTDIALLLHLTLSEEKEADALLTKLALEHVNVRQQREKIIST